MARLYLGGVVLTPRGYASTPLDCVICFPLNHRGCGCTQMCQLHRTIWKEGQERIAPFDVAPPDPGWDAFERQRLAEGECPYVGLRLVRRHAFDGPPAEDGKVFACGMCDCFGFNPEEVGGQ